MAENKGNFNSSNLSPEERQVARKQHLKEYCLKNKFDKNPLPEELHMLAVDDEQKFIYCVISKVGTTTWKKVLARPRGIRPGTNRWIMWKRLSNYTEEERSQRLKTYFKFVFVREPIQRMLSAYKDKFLLHERYTKDMREEIVKALRPKNYKPEGKNFVSFPEFLQYFSDNKTRNQHWRQYEKICHPCVVDYDFIGHMETLEEDATLLLRMMGIDDRTSYPPIQKQRTSSSEVLKYYSQVPTQYIERIAELYRSDFDMFGYEYLGPVKKLLDKEEEQHNNEY